MKNSQRGFIVPLLIAIIVVLVVVGGTYAYFNQQQKTQQTNQVENNTAITSDYSINKDQATSSTLPIITDVSSQNNSNRTFHSGDTVTINGSNLVISTRTGSSIKIGTVGINDLTGGIISATNQSITFTVPSTLLPGNYPLYVVGYVTDPISGSVKTIQSNNVQVTVLDDLQTSTSGWNTYKLKSSVGTASIKYPNGFNADGTSGLGDDGFQIKIQNKKDLANYNYSFSSIKSLGADSFYMQIWSYDNKENLPLDNWIKTSLLAGYNSPERVQIINENINLSGELISQRELKVDGKQAVQRNVLYKGVLKNITIVYTYVKEGDIIFQFINHNYGELDIYNQILSTFRFTK